MADLIYTIKGSTLTKLGDTVRSLNKTTEKMSLDTIKTELDKIPAKIEAAYADGQDHGTISEADRDEIYQEGFEAGKAESGFDLDNVYSETLYIDATAKVGGSGSVDVEEPLDPPLYDLSNAEYPKKYDTAHVYVNINAIYDEGYEAGENYGRDEGYSEGYSTGYDEGYYSCRSDMEGFMNDIQNKFDDPYSSGDYDLDVLSMDGNYLVYDNSYLVHCQVDMNGSSTYCDKPDRLMISIDNVIALMQDAGYTITEPED